MYKCKYSKVILWIIIILLSFVLGTWIAEKAKESIIAEVKEELGKEAATGEEFLFIKQDAETVMSMIPATTVVFGDNVGMISWEEGIMSFEGDADESARLFFEGDLKPIIDEYIKSEIQKNATIRAPIEISEDIMYLFSTSFDYDTFQPEWFMKVINTDMSKCFQDSRLRLNLNDEIYWMRLEKGKNIRAEMEKGEPDNVWPIIRLEAYDGGWLRPSSFLKTINTDVSEMMVDNRLKLVINGKVYWIRVEED